MRRQQQRRSRDKNVSDLYEEKKRTVGTMTIIQGYPPNYKQIVDVLHPAGNYIFTYGDKIYSPNTLHLPEDIVVHESVHQRQQVDVHDKFSVQKWWDKYLLDGRFRFQQELEAYREQWSFVQRHVKDRNLAHRMLVQMARDLSSENYGNVVTFSVAMEKIKE